MEAQRRESRAARTVLMAATLGFLVLTPTLLVARATKVKVNLEPGEYDFTVTYEIQGEQPARPKTTARCITREELDQPEEVFNDSSAAPRKENEPCAVKNLKGSGGKISYDADCSNRLVHVEGRVSRTEFVVVRNVRPKGSQGVPLRFTLWARRTGSCRMRGKGRKPQLPNPRGVEKDRLHRGQE